MECKYCKKSSADNDFICETKHWLVVLADDQSYIGRCVLFSKRHCGSLAELTQDEWLDFSVLVKILEAAMKKSFGAAMFNWNCFMNNAYKVSMPNPHVHWHFRPRYSHNVEFASLVFEDCEFGHGFDGDKIREVPDTIRDKIIEKIRENVR